MGTFLMRPLLMRTCPPHTFWMLVFPTRPATPL
ncbi:hypothetical protein SALBM311S_00560 [Streptomyces alboniger]